MGVRKLRKVAYVLLAALLVLSLAGCGSKSEQPSAPKTEAPKTEAPKPAQKVVLKLAHQIAEDSSLHKGAVKFKELADKYSGGTVEVQVFPSGQLGSEKDMIEGTKLGTIQMAVPSAGALAQFYQPAGVFGMPYIWNGTTEQEEYNAMIKVVRGPIGQDIAAKSAESTGILPLDFGWWYGDRHVTNSKRPIKTPQDLVGLKIRTPDAPVQVAPMKALGATVKWNAETRQIVILIP